MACRAGAMPNPVGHAIACRRGAKLKAADMERELRRLRVAFNVFRLRAIRHLGPSTRSSVT